MTKTLVQGHALEDQDDMIRKLSAIVEKQEKAMDVLTAKIIHLETVNDDNGERLNSFSYCLGVLELPQQVRESGSNPLVFDLFRPHFRFHLFRLLRDGLPFLLRLGHQLRAIQGVVWRGRIPVPAVNVPAVVVVKGVPIVVIVTVVLAVMQEGFTVGPPVHLRCSVLTC